jgi:hypothetical protein
METLTAFVRERAPWKEPDTSALETVVRFYEDARTDWTEPATDIAAVLAVIRRRPAKGVARERQRDWRFDLRATDLRGAKLNEAHLGGANLSGAHLDGASLDRTHLLSANLRGAHLERAYLGGAHLDLADLRGAHLERAYLGMGANLFYADLREAHLERADLTKAHLECADLSSADLKDVKDLDKAFGDAKTKLPDNVARPAHWPPYEPEAGERETVPPAPQPAVERDSKAPA